MAYRILADVCTGCGACETECPVQAISPKGDVFSIDPDKCIECKGHFDTPHCAEGCPVDACVPME